MSSNTYPVVSRVASQYEYQPADYAYDATDDNGFMTSPSPYAESPPSEWYTQQQPQDRYPTYNTTSPTPQAYFGRTEDPSYQQPAQRSQPSHEPPRSQHSTTESAPTGLVCLIAGCETHGRFRRRADLLRHINTVHVVSQRWNCPRPRCDRKAGRGFSRRDHLYEHLRNTHNVEVPTGGERRRRRDEAAA